MSTVGWVSASPVARTGYGRETKEVGYRIVDCGRDIVFIGTFGDVIIWGGVTEQLTPKGKKVTILSLTNPSSAAAVINEYVDKYDLKMIVGFMDCFGLEYLNDVKVPVIGYCVGGESLISTPLGSKSISDVKKGDIVWGYKNGEIVPTQVLAKSFRVVRGYHLLKTKKASLRITGEHPVWFSRDYIPVQNINIGNGCILTLGDNYYATEGDFSTLLDERGNSNYARIGSNVYKSGDSEKVKPNFRKRTNENLSDGAFPSQSTEKTIGDLPYKVGPLRNGMGLPFRDYRWRRNDKHSVPQEKEQKTKGENLLLPCPNGIDRKYFRKTGKLVSRKVGDKRALRGLEASSYFTLGVSSSIPQSDLHMAFNRLQNISDFGAVSSLFNDKEGAGETNIGFLGIPSEQESGCVLLQERNRGGHSSSEFEPSEEQIIQLERVVSGPTLVYNLKTKTKNFFANGILIHNCPIDGPYTPEMVHFTRNFHKIVAYSKFGYEELKKFYPPSRIGLIDHAVDVDTFKPLTAKEYDGVREWFLKEHGVPKDAFLAVSMGANVGPRKLLPLEMATFSKFVQKHPDAHLYIQTNAYAPGRGYNLISHRSVLGMEKNIHFATLDPIVFPAEDWELRCVFGGSQVFLHNAVAEGCGLPQREAMACGTPPIAPRNSAQTEQTEGLGWLVENIDPEDYVEYPVYVPTLQTYPVPSQKSMLEKLEEAYQNPDMVEAYGRRSRRFIVKNYSYKRIIPKWLGLLSEVDHDVEVLQTMRDSFQA